MSVSLRAFGRIPNLRYRLIYTLLVLIVFRLMAHIPIITVDQARLNTLLTDNAALGVIDLLAGGKVLDGFSIVAAGVAPYLAATFTLLIVALFIPALREPAATGEYQFTRLARWLTIPLALIMALGLSLYLDQTIGLFPNGIKLFTPTTFLPSLTIILTVTAGAVLSGWFADQITRFGIGPGAPIIIWAGACLTLAGEVTKLFSDPANPLTAPLTIGVTLVVVVLVIVIGIYLREGIRRIRIIYPGHIRPGRVSRLPAPDTGLPIRINPTGVKPAIAATGSVALIAFIGNLLQSSGGSWAIDLGRALTQVFDPQGAVYWLTMFVLIVGMTYLYNDVFITSRSIAENLRRTGAMIPGARPGAATDTYVYHVARRVTLPAALLSGMILAVLPYGLRLLTHQDFMPIILAVLLSVDVVSDLTNQLRAEALLHSYEGLLVK